MKDGLAPRTDAPFWLPANRGITPLLMRKTRYHFNVIFRTEPEGGFTAVVPALPGCVTDGRTLVEARKMVKGAISGYIESLRKHREPIPTEETLVASLDLEYAQTSRR